MSWVCPNCSHINEDDTDRCLVCDAARPEGSSAPEKPVEDDLKVIVSEEGEALKRKVYSGTPAPVRTKPVTTVRKTETAPPKRRDTAPEKRDVRDTGRLKREEKERRKRAAEEELRRRREEREKLRRDEEDKKRREVEAAEKKRAAEEDAKKKEEEKAAYRDEFEYHMWTFLGRSQRIGLAALGVTLIVGIFTMGPAGLFLELFDNLRLLLGLL